MFQVENRIKYFNGNDEGDQQFLFEVLEHLSQVHEEFEKGIKKIDKTWTSGDMKGAIELLKEMKEDQWNYRQAWLSQVNLLGERSDDYHYIAYQVYERWCYTYQIAHALESAYNEAQNIFSEYERKRVENERKRAEEQRKRQEQEELNKWRGF